MGDVTIHGVGSLSAGSMSAPIVGHITHTALLALMTQFITASLATVGRHGVATLNTTISPAALGGVTRHGLASLAGSELFTIITEETNRDMTPAEHFLEAESLLVTEATASNIDTKNIQNRMLVLLRAMVHASLSASATTIL